MATWLCVSGFSQRKCVHQLSSIVRGLAFRSVTCRRKPSSTAATLSATAASASALHAAVPTGLRSSSSARLTAAASGSSVVAMWAHRRGRSSAAVHRADVPLAPCACFSRGCRWGRRDAARGSCAGFHSTSFDDAGGPEPAGVRHPKDKQSEGTVEAEAESRDDTDTRGTGQVPAEAKEPAYREDAVRGVDDVPAATMEVAGMMRMDEKPQTEADAPEPTLPSAHTHRAEAASETEAYDGEHTEEDGAPLDRLIGADTAAELGVDPRLASMGWAAHAVGAHEEVADELERSEAVPQFDGVETFDAASGLLLRRAKLNAADAETAVADVAASPEEETTLRRRVREAAEAHPVLAQKLPAHWQWEGVESLALLLERFHPFTSVRIAALRALGSLGEKAAPAMGAIVACLADPQRSVRRAAAAVITDMHATQPEVTSRYLDAVAGLVAHRKVEVRLQAAQLFAEFGTHAVSRVEALREQLRTERAPAVQYALARSLASLGDSEGADWIEGFGRPKPRPPLHERLKRMQVRHWPLSPQTLRRREMLRKQLHGDFPTDR